MNALLHLGPSCSGSLGRKSRGFGSRDEGFGSGLGGYIGLYRVCRDIRPGTNQHAKQLVN